MRITEITLYRETPLDVDYENVFDGYTTRAELLTFLNNYSRKVITPDGVRSQISNDIGLQMVIDGEQDVIREYNYAYVASGTKGFFYFVVDTQSVNDNTQKPQTRITLKWDAFTNNYAEMRSSNRGTKQMVECRHFEECYNNLLEQGRPYINNIITDEEEIATYMTVGSDLTPKVLWAKIVTGSELYFSGATGSGREWKPYYYSGASPIGGGLKTFYVPFWARNCIEAKIRGGSDTHMRYMRNITRDIVGLSVSSTEVISVSLTWYAPYRTEIEDDILYIYVNDEITNETNPTAITPYGYFSATGGNNAKSIVTEGLFGEGEGVRDVLLLAAPDHGQIPQYSYNVSLSKPMPDRIDDTDNILPSLDWFMYEARIYSYPYLYKSYMINNNVIPIIPPAGNTLLTISVEYYNKPEVEARFAFQGTSTSPIYTHIKSVGELQFSADSLEYYNRNNGSQITAGVLGSVVSAIANPATIPAGAVGVVNTVAKMIDADKQRDSYTIPTINALSDLHYQDAITLIANEPLDNLQLQRVAMKFHYYGININVINDININYHTNFDYIRTKDCKLVSVANRKDRAELEQAYDRGITRWHIKNPYDGKVNNINYLMNKEIYNLSINQYKYYSGVYKEA